LALVEPDSAMLKVILEITPYFLLLPLMAGVVAVHTPLRLMVYLVVPVALALETEP